VAQSDIVFLSLLKARDKYHGVDVYSLYEDAHFLVASGVVANLELGERSRIWGGAPSRVQGQSPWSVGQGAKRVFGYPREWPFFTSPQNFVNFINHTYFK